MKQKWNAAVLAIARMWPFGARTASVLGIAGNCPPLRLGYALVAAMPDSELDRVADTVRSESGGAG
jgi:hypothetical protein